MFAALTANASMEFLERAADKARVRHEAQNQIEHFAAVLTNADEAFRDADTEDEQIRLLRMIRNTKYAAARVLGFSQDERAIQPLRAALAYLDVGTTPFMDYLHFDEAAIMESNYQEIVMMEIARSLASLLQYEEANVCILECLVKRSLRLQSTTSNLLSPNNVARVRQTLQRLEGQAESPLTPFEIQYAIILLKDPGQYSGGVGLDVPRDRALRDTPAQLVDFVYSIPENDPTGQGTVIEVIRETLEFSTDADDREKLVAFNNLLAETTLQPEAESETTPSPSIDLAQFRDGMLDAYDAFMAAPYSPRPCTVGVVVQAKPGSLVDTRLFVRLVINYVVVNK